jgi:hypothetical protein
MGEVGRSIADSPAQTFSDIPRYFKAVLPCLLSIRVLSEQATVSVRPLIDNVYFSCFFPSHEILLTLPSLTDAQRTFNVFERRSALHNVQLA